MVGFNIRSDPKRRPAVDLAISTRSSTLSHLTDLVIGGKGVIVYAPVFQGDAYRGMVSGVLGQHDWLRSLIDGRFADHYFELWRMAKSCRPSTSDSPKSAGEWSVELPVAVKNARWALRVAPTQEYVQSARSPLPRQRS